MSLWRALVPALLGVAAAGAVLRSANSSSVGRAAGVLAAAAIGLVAVGVWRERRWAYGAAFFLGLFWLWAVVALGVQGVIAAPEILGWVAWSVAVLVGAVRSRPT